MNFQNIKVVESAEVETEVLPQKRISTVVISLISSIIIGCIIAFIIEFISGKLYKEKEIEKILRAPMIGAIPILNNCLVSGEKYDK